MQWSILYDDGLRSRALNRTRSRYWASKHLAGWCLERLLRQQQVRYVSLGEACLLVFPHNDVGSYWPAWFVEVYPSRNRLQMHVDYCDSIKPKVFVAAVIHKERQRLHFPGFITLDRWLDEPVVLRNKRACRRVELQHLVDMDRFFDSVELVKSDAGKVA